MSWSVAKWASTLLLSCALTQPAFAQDNETPAEQPDANTKVGVQQDAPSPTDGPVDEAYGAFQRGMYLTALALALPRAKNDDPAAQTLIAELYANGFGVGRNLERAASWYEIAAKNGGGHAAFQLGLMYQSGEAVTQDRQKAAELIKKKPPKRACRKPNIIWRNCTLRGVSFRPIFPMRFNCSMRPRPPA